MPGNGKRAGVSILQYNVMIMYEGYHVICQRRMYKNPGVNALKAFTCIIKLYLRFNKGLCILHPCLVQLKRFYGSLPAHPVPQPPFHKAKMRIQKVILVIATQQNEIFSKLCRKFLYPLKYLPGIRPAVK